MTESVWDALLAPENIALAWRRYMRDVANSAQFVEQREVGAFGAHLERNLTDVRDRLARGSWQTSPLRAAPKPKATGGRSVTPPLREIFWVDPADQIAWLAVAQIIGSSLDAQMPGWSYGFRLIDGPGSLAPNRPDSLFYSGPGQSWPVFKRHVLLMAQAMRKGAAEEHASAPPAELRHGDAEEVARAAGRLPFWNRLAGRFEQVRFVTLDFAAFTPSIDADATMRVLSARCDACRSDPRFAELVAQMLAFHTDAGERLSYVPMGLVPQGLLNNIALLPIDDAVDRALISRPIAHFRSVDDHVVLAPDLASLSEWIGEYRDIVAGFLPKLRFSPGKVRPSELAPLLDGRAVPADAGILNESGPDALWQPADLREPDADSFSARPWPEALSSTIFGVLAGDALTEAGVWPDLERANDDMLLAEMAATRQIRLFQSFRDRGGLLRGILLLLAHSGADGLDGLIDDALAVSQDDPRVGSTLQSLMLTQIAPILASAALRATDVGTPEPARIGPARFLVLAAQLTALRPGEGAGWAHVQAWANVQCAARLMLAVHDARIAGQPGAAGLATAASAIGVASREDATAWARWFMDFDCAPPSGAAA